MSEEMIVRHCAPTLAGLKTANMFNCPCADRSSLEDQIRKLNLKLGNKGLRLIPLRFSKGKALIYVYRPKKLEQDLKNSEAAELLCEKGYNCDSVGCCLSLLMKRLREQSEFPHEIGLFLGYTPSDVKCYMHDRNCGCKCTGCWRVYSNEHEAEKLFARYKKCTDVYCRSLSTGTTLEKLTVASR